MALFPQRGVRARAPGKASCAPKASAPVQVGPPTFQVEAPADPPVAQASANISMKEEVQLCEAFSEALLTVQDVDKDDEDQPQLCSKYVKDIYGYLHDLEVKDAGALLWGCPTNACAVAAGAAGCTSKLHAGL